MSLQNSTKQSLHRLGRKAQGIRKDAATSEEINLAQGLLKMNDGSSFLLYDDNGGQSDRILVFSSSKGRESFSKCNLFFMVGTFKSCSKQFTQN